MIFGMTVLEFVLRLVLAVLAFFIVRWLFPLLMGALHLVPPDPIPTLLALAVALLVFFGYPTITGRRVPPRL